MLAIFIISGKYISLDNKHYWRYAIWPTIMFTLVLGLRLNRGNDYIHYMQVYLFDLEDKQVLFTSFNHFLKSLGTGPHWIFIWYSGAFILGAMFFLKRFREYAAFVLPLFLIAFTHFSEYMIRQAFGYSFVFLFLAFMFSDKMSKLKRLFCLLLCFWLSYSIHAVNAITCTVSLVLYYGVKKPFKPIYSIPLYLIATVYLQNHFDFSYLSGLLSFIGEQNDKFSHYTENSDVWFSNNAMNAMYARNFFVKIFQTLGDCSLMYITYNVLKNNPNIKFQFFYNTFVLGAIFSQCFYTLEILRRMGDIMYWNWAFPLAYFLYNRKRYICLSRLVEYLSISLLFYCYEYLKYLFFRTDDMYKFLWDM